MRKHAWMQPTESAVSHPAPRLLFFLKKKKIALRYLDKAGYRSVVANDGREVIDIFQTQGPFDLILMDCQVCPDLLTDSLGAATVVDRTKKTQKRNGCILLSTRWMCI